jgi:protein-L-isoaspartate(D-aspartate) O-methyltransferase
MNTINSRNQIWNKFDMDFKEIREFMLKTQLISRGIKDEIVLNAMKKVPRHLFVDDSMQNKAYEDTALPIGEGQTISQPYMVAVMTELLELKGNEKVLEIGTGSGYQTAILAELAKEVYTVERVAVLAKRSEERLHSLGYNNIHIKVGDGTIGWAEESPFNRILITAGCPKIPNSLIEQIAEGGIIIAPVGDRFSQQLLKVRKSKDKLLEQYHTPCVFVPLIGAYGWKEEY